MIMTKSVYTLIKKDIPIIKGKHIQSDARVGGEKLVYKRVTYPVQAFKLFIFLITIPLVPKKGEKTEAKVVYLRPYKKNWSATHKREKLPFHLWGKKEHPLTNLWVELEFDYKDIIKSIPVMKTRVEDHSLIKFLRQHAEKFSLIN